MLSMLKCRSWVARSIMGAAISFSLTGCLPSQWEYLVANNGRVTQEQIKDEFGDPYLIKDVEDQGTMWTYRYEKSGSPIGRRGDMIGGQPCIEYAMTFDSEKTLANWTRQPCSAFRIRPSLYIPLHTTAVVTD